MKKSWIVTGAIILLVVIAIFNAIGTYNTMIEKDEVVAEKWAQVENVYQRRADLIPNLVEVVKGYAKHEREVLTDVVEARAKASSINVSADQLNASTIQKFKQAQEGLGSALSRLMVVVERYPDLKANQNFLELQAQLEGTENRITVERMKFNQAAKDYNAYIRKFPKNLYANMFDFEKKAYFEATEGAEKAPKIDF